MVTSRPGTVTTKAQAGDGRIAESSRTVVTEAGGLAAESPIARVTTFPAHSR